MADEKLNRIDEIEDWIIELDDRLRSVETELRSLIYEPEDLYEGEELQ